MSRCSSLLHLSILLIVLAAPRLHAETRPDPARSAAAFFTENRGQIVDERGRSRPDLLFVAHTRSASYYFSHDRVTHVVRAADPSTLSVSEATGLPISHDRPTMNLCRFDMELVGANTSMSVGGEEEKAFASNFYLAHCPDGITGVRSFGRVVYRNVQPGVDLIFESDGEEISHRYVVRPGGRLEELAVRYRGATTARTTSGVSVRTPIGSHVERTAFRLTSGETISGNTSVDRGVIRYRVGKLDRARTVVISPEIAWATYHGGPSTDRLARIAVDSSDNVIAAGTSEGAGYPTTPGVAQPTFGGALELVVVSTDRAGALRWATYYGGSGIEAIGGIAAGSDGSSAIMGHTTSNDFPVSANAVQPNYTGPIDLLIVRLDRSGARLWATYYGGTGIDNGAGVACDGEGNIIVTGETTSLDFPTTSGAFQKTLSGNVDAVVVKLTADGAVRWSTLFGGSGEDQAMDVGVDRNGAVVIGGTTNSDDLFTTDGVAQTTRSSPASECFVTRFDALGILSWCSYYGGSGHDYFSALSVAPGGEVVLTGYAGGPEFPTTVGAVQREFGGTFDMFVVALDPAARLRWATLYGGAGFDMLTDVTWCADGDLMIVGYTDDSAFATTPQGLQPGHGGIFDATILRFSNDGALRWSTLFGSASDDLAYSIDIDRSGHALIAMGSGSDDLPTTPGAIQPAGGDRGDGYLLSLRVEPPATVHVDADDDASALLVGDAISIDGRRLDVSFTLRRSATMSIEIYTSAGERVVETTHGLREAGENTMELDLGALPAGWYLLRLRAGNEIVVRRFVVGS